jgi:hypothetical protein
MVATGARLAALGFLLALIGAAPASAQAPPFAPYDGVIPFNCQLQDVGTGTDFPDPDADPFCVEFDKTSQNVLPNAGLVDFLANEPARVAAASPKCFYFQRDHWTGSLVQGQPPELWHWDGNYYFDKAKGTGGVSVRNFRVGGQPQNAGQFAPPEYAPYFDDNGGGGVEFTLESGPDPTCVARVDTPEEQEEVYATSPQYRDCIPPGGRLKGKRVGKVKLRMARDAVHGEIGEPDSTEKGTDRWCVIGDANLHVRYRKGGAALIRTTSRGHDERGVAPGMKAKKAKRKLGLDQDFRIKGAKVAEAPERAGRELYVGFGKRVKWLAMVDPNRLRSERSVKRALKKAR